MDSDEEGLTRQQYKNIITKKTKPLFVKFTADWCGPCKRIKPLVDNFLTPEVLDKISYLEIDIDNSIDVYAFMKSKKMLNGIPTLFVYTMDNTSFAPTLSTSTGSENVAQKFLETVKNVLKL